MLGQFPVLQVSRMFSGIAFYLVADASFILCPLLTDMGVRLPKQTMGHIGSFKYRFTVSKNVYISLIRGRLLSANDDVMMCVCLCVGRR